MSNFKWFIVFIVFLDGSYQLDINSYQNFIERYESINYLISEINQIKKSIFEELDKRDSMAIQIIQRRRPDQMITQRSTRKIKSNLNDEQFEPWGGK